MISPIRPVLLAGLLTLTGTAQVVLRDAATRQVEPRHRRCVAAGVGEVQEPTEIPGQREDGELVESL